MSLYPLKFRPRLVPKMWGGRKLETVLGKALPPDAPIGEAWELYDFPPGVIDNSSGWVSSEIANGPFAGKTLHDLILSHGKAVHGDVPLVGPHGQFPTMIKFLDAREDLSIQVHPDAKYAAAHPDAHLKTEAWYVVEHDANAKLYKGLRSGTTCDAFKRAIENGTVEDHVVALPVKEGQCHFMPSGFIHALGAGILAFEIQTPSDTTFRVYDFNRIDPSTGKKRTLHVEQALECIDFSGAPEPKQPRGEVSGRFSTVSRLVTSNFFKLEKVRIAKGTHEPLPYDQPTVWTLLEGEAEVKVQGLPEPTHIGRGETVLLPARMNQSTLRTLSECVWLEATFPIPPSQFL